MKHILHLLLIIPFLVSCSPQYTINGSSSVSLLDGKMLYLKVVKDNNLCNYDSCEVVHGLFHFQGSYDSTMMATLFMDDESLMPLVIEKGDITIKIDDSEQIVFGTPLNEKLYDFIKSKTQLDNQKDELSHKESQMIMDGVDQNVIEIRLTDEAKQIVHQEDVLSTNFITTNFDNVLGPGVFMIICSNYKYPILTPQIEDIMSKATPYFKANKFVQDYYKTARENMKRMGYTSTDDDILSTSSDTVSDE